MQASAKIQLILLVIKEWIQENKEKREKYLKL